MDFRLTEEQRMIRESALKFARKWEPHVEEMRALTLKGEFPEEFWKELCGNGFRGR